MKQSHNLSIYNTKTALFIIYGIPLLIWPLSLLDTFSGLEKLGCILCLCVIILGSNLIHHDIVHTKPKKPFKKRRYAMPDLNVSLRPLATPQLTITLVLAGICGGLLSFYYLNETLLTFLSAAITFFTIVLGIEYMFQDLVRKIYKIKDKTIADFFYRTSKLLPFIHNNLAGLLCAIAGYYLYNVFYFQDPSSSLTGAVILGIIGKGMSLFKSK